MGSRRFCGCGWRLVLAEDLDYRKLQPPQIDRETVLKSHHLQLSALAREQSLHFKDLKLPCESVASQLGQAIWARLSGSDYRSVNL